MLVVALASGARFLHFTTDYRVFFSHDDPRLKVLDALHRTYTKDDTVLFILTPKDGQVFTPTTLASIAWLTKQAWRLPYVQRVDSLQNFQYTYARGDELVVQDFYHDPERLRPADLKRLKQIALDEPLLKNRLISPQADVTGVSVSVRLPGVDEEREVPQVVAHAKRLAAELSKRDPNLEVRLTGGVLMSYAFPEASLHDLKTLVPAMAGLVLVVLYLLLRSAQATWVAGLAILCAIASTMGLAGWLGVPISPPAAAAPNIILTVAVADSVHVLISFLLAMQAGWLQPKPWSQVRLRALEHAFRLNLRPMFLTNFTTALGFLSLNFSNSPPFRDLGNLSALGVGFAFGYTLVLAPCLLLALPSRPSKPPVGQNGMVRLGEWVIARRRGCLTLMLGAVVGLGALLPNNELNDDLIQYFSPATPFRQHAEYATAHLTGMYVMDYSLPASGPGGVTEPEYLRVLDEFAAWYRKQPEVIHVFSLADIIKRLNRNLHGDDPAWYQIPESRELAAQYLLLYEMSLPEGLELTDRINVDKSASRFTATLKNLSSREMLDLERRARAWMAQNAPAYMQAQATGPNLIFAHIGQSNISGMILGTAVEFAVIALVLVAALRSVGLGLLSLVSNTVPALLAYGLWGGLNGQINMGLSVVASMTLGIVVDDTVHFLSKWQHARTAKDGDRTAAVRYAFAQVGAATLVFSLVLAAGFLVLTGSDFTINAQMGLLTAITIGFALVADLFFLPPLLLVGVKDPGLNLETLKAR
ncbi:MMPL family transporter [Methylothermus subterraneus]